MSEQRSTSRSLRFVLLVSATLIACSALGLWYYTHTLRLYTDGRTIEQVATGAPLRDILWQPPIALEAPLNGEADDYEPKITLDGQTLYFVRGKAGGSADIYQSSKTLDGWSDPQPLSINTEFDELGPQPSRDGQTLYFYSDRPEGLGGYDIWKTSQVDGQWQAPKNLGSALNTEYNEYGFALSADEQTIYLSSNRPHSNDDATPQESAWTATIREDIYIRDYDLFVATQSAGKWNTTALDILNTQDDEGAPALSPVEDFLYFSSDRSDSNGGFDLYRARILPDGLEHPENLKAPVNDARNQTDPALTMGGFGLYFSADDDQGDYDLYYSSSREVYVVGQDIPWKELLPTLLWALLALLGLLLLLMLIRGDAYHKLSLMARCILMSLLLHALLLFLLSCWYVTTKLGELSNRKGPIHIALQRESGGNIVEQIRGTATPLELERTMPQEQVAQPPAVQTPEITNAFTQITPQTITLPQATDISAQVTPASSAQPITEFTPIEQPIELSDPQIETRFEPQFARTAQTESTPEFAAPLPDVDAAEVPLEQPQASSELVASKSELSTDLPTVPQVEINLPKPNIQLLPTEQAPRAAVVEVPTMQHPAELAKPRAESVQAQQREQQVVVQPQTDSLEPIAPAQPEFAQPQELVTAQPSLLSPEPTLLQEERSELNEQRTASTAPELLSLEQSLEPAIEALPIPTIELTPPDAVVEAPNAYAQREPEVREELIEKMGGSEETERAVALSLDWLARHQSRDGHWDTRHYDRRCGQCAGDTQIPGDVAITGLSVLCFLAANHTHMNDSPYSDRLKRALRWLTRRQRKSGDLRRGETLYSHAIATIALAEAYAMTQDPALRKPVQDAIDFIIAARHDRSGAWRYDPGQYGDTSVLGWQIMALRSAKQAGFEVPQEMFDGAYRWLQRVARGPLNSRYCYQPGERPTPSMTAEGMFIMQLLGKTADEPTMQASARYLTDHLPDWEEEPNTYMWYYATLALYQHQGEPWNEWNEHLKQQLLDNQYQTGPQAGSWDITDQWSKLGGRVYQTAICTLMLEVYYRYLPQFIAEQPQLSNVDPRD